MVLPSACGVRGRSSGRDPGRPVLTVDWHDRCSYPRTLRRQPAGATAPCTHDVHRTGRHGATRERTRWTGRTQGPDHRPLDGRETTSRTLGSGLKPPCTNVRTGSNPVPGTDRELEICDFGWMLTSVDRGSMCTKCAQNVVKRCGSTPRICSCLAKPGRVTRLPVRSVVGEERRHGRPGRSSREADRLGHGPDRGLPGWSRRCRQRRDARDPTARRCPKPSSIGP